MSWRGMGPGGPGGWGGSGAPGLPFAGIPPEYADKIGPVAEQEPDYPVVDAEFSHVVPEDRGFKLRSFLGPHWRALAVGVVLMASEQGLKYLGPKLTGRAIDSVHLAGDLETAQWLAGIFLASVLLAVGVNAVRILWTGRLGQTLLYGLRVRVFSHLQRLSLDFYTREKGGRIMTRMTSDIEALSQLFTDGIVNLLNQGFALLAMTAFMLTVSVPVTLMLLVGVVPVMVLLTLWFRRESSVAYNRVRERIADVLADLQESLAGVRVVAMHNRQRHNIVRHRNVVGRHRDANVDAARIAAIYGSSSESVGFGAQALVIAAAGLLAYERGLSVGEMTAFVLYMPMFFGPIQQLVQLHNVYQQGQAAVEKLRSVFVTDPSVPEAPNARDLPPVEGTIRFEGVTFAYEPGQDILRDVDLEIRKGETVALVGNTGAGKSTLAKLVNRFYDPQRGAVSIDGHDLRGVTLDSLRRQIGVVPQEPFLFGGSIRDNIAFARPDATDAEVLEACRAVGIEELIDRLPQGVNTPCHERGVTLSSGERQLIALARAFMADPRVLVLDEATSNLDLQTEAMVERALDALLGRRTAILIAHRLSTAMRADRIAVVHDGGIAEIGSHAELVARGGLYASMYETWVRHGTDPTEEVVE